MMQSSDPDTMLEFEHGGDPEVPTFVRNGDIIAVLPNWDVPKAGPHRKYN